MRPKIRLAFFGLAGTGTSTVCKIISNKFEIPYFYAGGIMRELAAEHNMTIEEFDKFIKSEKKEGSVDFMVDSKMNECSKENNELVIEGRLAYHFAENVINVKFICDEDERIKRLVERDNQADFETVKKIHKDREEFLIGRYNQIYKDIVYPPKDEFFDLIIDTTTLNPEEVVQEILYFLEK